MKSRSLYLLPLGLGLLASGRSLLADNPLIMDQFTADPSAHVFNGKIFVYPSHDIQTRPGAWFSMEDYHTFSSENLMDWKDEGVILDQKQVPWAQASNNMWAPDCNIKNGKYYFYFPDNNRVGVAISDKPEGPFKAEPTAIAGAGGIDPCIFVDPKDGAAYLIWANNSTLGYGKLKDNMTEFDGSPQAYPKLVQGNDLVEGPYMFERKGVYYLTFPHSVRLDTNHQPVASGGHQAEDLEYAMGPSPTGPFTYKGVFMDQSPSGCWTNHHSFVEYKGQWLLFYHDKDLAPDNDRNRSIHADYVTFNDDGTIQKVAPTLRGIGIADATHKIQIDRYSAVSKTGATDSFLNDAKRFDGWKISLTDKDAWVEYDRVDFGKGDEKAVNVRAMSATGGTIEIHADKADGPLLAKVTIDKSDDWKTLNAKVANVPGGVHNLVVTMPEKNDVQIDWVSFE